MNDLEHIDVAVIGGGVIGLAIARELSRAGREVMVIERERALGTHTTARNSEVIHAGIYYPRGSLKAQLCVAGKSLLYDYCEQRSVPHRRLGKLIVATRDEDLKALEKIGVHARENGVNDLVWLTAREVLALEPQVRAVAGWLSPSTGIIDCHSYVVALRREAQDHGAGIVLASAVEGGQVLERGIELWLRDPQSTRIRCNAVINAAGLWAPEVARSIEGIPPATLPSAYFAKGHYFTMSGASPFRHLVYPVPVPGGLGTHVTLDLAGQVRFGPDVQWVDGVDYSFDASRVGSFYDAIRTYYPALQDGALMPGYTGIRPKLSPQGSPAADFVIQGPETHGIAGLVQLFGIESPGITASLAIAAHVRTLLDGSEEAPQSRLTP